MPLVLGYIQKLYKSIITKIKKHLMTILCQSNVPGFQDIKLIIVHRVCSIVISFNHIRIIYFLSWFRVIKKSLHFLLFCIYDNDIYQRKTWTLQTGMKSVININETIYQAEINTRGYACKRMRCIPVICFDVVCVLLHSKQCCCWCLYNWNYSVMFYA
jgi:hypothetical protein